MKTTREVIKSFLDAAAAGNLPRNPMEPKGQKRPLVNNPDMLERFSINMEVQVNVSGSGAEAVEGRRNTWTKDGVQFWNIRIPADAMTDFPHFEDKVLPWSLSMNAEAVGMTGWDWCHRVSRWVAFDFDAITGHAPGVGVDEVQLSQVREAAMRIPWVQTRKSTRGKGYHMYVYFDDAGIPTENHTIHQGLGRCILSKMSQESGFNFASAIDACGGNMWIWHRDATAQNEGLAVIQDSTQELTLSDLPINWRDHIDVVTRKRTKIKVRGIPTKEDEAFDVMASARDMVSLDEVHHEIIEALSEECNCTTVWIPEYNLLQTHTAGFAQLRETHPDKYAGFFETNSDGNNLAEPNAFAFPMADGGWKVYRFSKGHHEHETWDQDGRGYTTTFFNCRPNLKAAALSMQAAKSKDGSFYFTCVRHAMQAMTALGVKATQMDDIKQWAEGDRKVILKHELKSNELSVRVEKHESDAKPSHHWILNKTFWERMFEVECDPREMKNVDYPEYDGMYRVLMSTAGDQAGWAAWDASQKEWDMHPSNNIKLMLQSDFVAKGDAEHIMGTILKKRWRLVNMPFQPEFPGNRQWNHKAPQLNYAPAILGDKEEPVHPHWDMILDHIGKDLGEVLVDDIWANKYNVKTGRQYLQLWIAAMLREPFEPLPYLFLHGPENSGKSIFHEAARQLFTGGYCKADNPLKTTGEHNGELANAVLAVVEETNLNGKNGERALNRMKDWITSDYIAIRQMRTDTYMLRNSLHFVHCANDRSYCPIMHGDTRVTMLYVSEIDYDDEIPKSLLKKSLEAEAPHFMRTLMDWDIPPASGRLRIPVMATREKEAVEALTMDPIARFFTETAFECPGAKVLFGEVYDRFRVTLSADDEEYWSQKQFSLRLPRPFVTGKSGGKGGTYVGNISWSADSKTTGQYLEVVKGRLKLKPLGRRSKK